MNKIKTIAERIRENMGGRSSNGAAPRLVRSDDDDSRKAPEPWGELVPLAATPDAPPFPVGVLPPLLRSFVEEGAAALHCPLDYVGVPLLALAGAAIGASRALEIKPGWTERPAIYGAVVGPPGSAKTPALKLVSAPVHAEQARLHEIYRRERKAHEDGVEDKPEERTLYISDCTCEKLAIVLQDTPRGVVMIRDELTGWVMSLNQYKGGKGADRQFFLSAWSGDPVSVHRKNQDAGPVHVPHPFLAVVGGLPPDLLGMFRGERGVSDGFLDRILFAYPEPSRAIGEDWTCVPDECLDAWRDTVARLWELQQEHDAERGPRPHFVRLATCGRRAWERFTMSWADEVNGDSFPDCLRGPWSKFRGYCGRLALIVHELRRVHGESVSDDVDGDSLDRGVELVRYFQGHARKVYALIDADPKIAEARRVVRWIAENRLQRFSKRDAYQGLKGTFATVEELGAPMALLEKHGVIRLELSRDRPGPGRPPSPVYDVHPDLLQPDSHNPHNPQK